MIDDGETCCVIYPSFLRHVLPTNTSYFIFLETCVVEEKLDKPISPISGVEKGIEVEEMSGRRVEVGLFSAEQLHRLEQNPEIARLLSHSSIQECIKDVNTSEQPHETLRAFRENPDMEAFVQLCLSTVQHEDAQ
jgi:hypothetical protein